MAWTNNLLYILARSHTTDSEDAKGGFSPRWVFELRKSKTKRVTGNIESCSATDWSHLAFGCQSVGFCTLAILGGEVAAARSSEHVSHGLNSVLHSWSPSLPFVRLFLGLVRCSL